MRTHTLSIFFIALLNITFGQLDDDYFEEKMAMNKAQNEYSWAYKNIFLEQKLTGPGTELMIRRTSHTYYRHDSWDPTAIDTLTFSERRFPITIFGYALEPRLNLVNGKNYSLHLKAPITFSFSIMGYEYGNQYSLGRGYFHLTAPILLGYTVGLNSTYNNCKKKGLSIAAGIQYVRSPLMGGNVELHSGYDSNEYTGLDDIPDFKNWVMPLAQIDYYFLTANNKIRGISVAFNPYRTFYIKFAYNIIATKK